MGLRGGPAAARRGRIPGRVVPALCFQAFAVGIRPVLGEPLFLEELRQHQVLVLQDAHFHRHDAGVQHASDVGIPAPETPQHLGARLDVESRHRWRGAFRAPTVKLLG
jgi:hypothetical protein